MPSSIPTLAGLHAHHSVLNLHVGDVRMQSMRCLPTRPSIPSIQLCLQLQLCCRQLQVCGLLPQEALEMLCPFLHVLKGACLSAVTFQHAPNLPLFTREPALYDIMLVCPGPLPAFLLLEARPGSPSLSGLLVNL